MNEHATIESNLPTFPTILAVLFLLSRGVASWNDNTLEWLNGTSFDMFSVCVFFRETSLALPTHIRKAKSRYFFSRSLAQALRLSSSNRSVTELLTNKAGIDSRSY